MLCSAPHKLCQLPLLLVFFAYFDIFHNRFFMSHSLEASYLRSAQGEGGREGGILKSITHGNMNVIFLLKLIAGLIWVQYLTFVQKGLHSPSNKPIRTHVHMYYYKHLNRIWSIFYVIRLTQFTIEPMTLFPWCSEGTIAVKLNTMNYSFEIDTVFLLSFKKSLTYFSVVIV